MNDEMTTRDDVKNGSDDSSAQTAAEHLRDLQRLAAEFSNYRKRADAEKNDVVRYANADLIRRLLTVLDSFDRALEQMPPELQRFSWVEGIWLVERQLRAILEQEGLVPISAVGRLFDPFEMEAVMYDETSDVPEGTVISEMQKGYKLNDRAIRPALVKLAKAPQAHVKEAKE
ncbi:MAG: nucleotide exchange factor GrpE [Chloroflexi bacterium 13_1_40CM_4_68_4]|nr:MAG: nucleotide exchange factor GrpE [Chloroflexi bacterium 13_1_40CM_4_68_4]